MKLAKIIGRVVSTQKVASFEGLKLVLIQPVDEKRKESGDALVAIDTLGADIGQTVYYETSKEASRVILKEMNPCDAAIMAIVDDIQIAEK